MKRFAYEALDGQGSKISGTVEAESLQMAIKSLKQEGLDPSYVQEEKPLFKGIYVGANSPQSFFVSDANLAMGKRIAWFLMLGGCVAAIIGSIWSYYTLAFVKSAARTSGTITAINLVQSSHGPAYHPVFTFTDASGAVYTRQESTGSSSCPRGVWHNRKQ